MIAANLVIITEVENDNGKFTTYIDEFKLLDDKKSKELFKLNGETVEVHGVFVEEDDGTVYLQVKSYKLIKSKDEEINEEDPNVEHPNGDESEEPSE